MKKRVKKFVALLVIFLTVWSPLAANAQSGLFIRFNQLGFRPDDMKTAVVFGRESLPAEFRILNAETGAVVFIGRTKPVDGRWGEFEHHGELNFSQLRTEGKYVVELGSVRSQEFAVAKFVDRDIADQLLEFMRQQRCGYNPTSTRPVTPSTAARPMDQPRRART